MADNPKVKGVDGDFRPLSDEVVTRNGSPIGVDSVQAQVVKIATGADGIATDVSASSPFPTADSAVASALASLATQTTLASVLAKLSSDPATQTTLAALLTALTNGSARVGGTVTTVPTAAGDVATTLTNGRKMVTTAGTAVALRTSLACKWVTVTALSANTAKVYVGGSGVLAAAGSETGIPLSALDSVTIPVADASSVFVDALVSGEGVSFVVGA